MLKLIKTKTAFLAAAMITMTAPLNACGEKTMTSKQPTVYSFKHKIPDSFEKKSDFSSDEFKPFRDDGIFFWGGALGDPDANTFDIGVQFHTKIEGRRVFIEKMILDTPDLKTERDINDFVDIDIFSERDQYYFKRFLPFEKISGDSIPLTAKFFTLKIEYRLDDSPTKQMFIRFNNVSFLAPVL